MGGRRRQHEAAADEQRAGQQEQQAGDVEKVQREQFQLDEQEGRRRQGVAGDQGREGPAAVAARPEETEQEDDQTIVVLAYK